MPKAPILNREAFYSRLRDGSYRDLDWHLVNTSLGAMVEPRQILGIVAGKVTQRDVYDASVTKLTEFNEDKMFTLLGTAGPQVPVDFNV